MNALARHFACWPPLAEFVDVPPKTGCAFFEALDVGVVEKENQKESRTPLWGLPKRHTHVFRRDVNHHRCLRGASQGAHSDAL